MTELPTGTVTFIFTDVEGSTKLLHELGAEAYDEALVEHRRVLREAFAATAASRWTRRATPSSTRSPLRPARCRLQAKGNRRSPRGRSPCAWACTPARRSSSNEGYIGDDVHLGARVAASGHGGQVVLS